jgi:hypothetical protein
MGQLTVETATTKGGFNFLRSDGQRFFMVFHDDGSASLYAGADRDTPPQYSIINLAANVQKKLDVAKKCIVAYPDHPA